MGVLRKAAVTSLTSTNILGLKYTDSGAGGPAIVARGFLGGLYSGFHAVPAVNDQVIVGSEGDLPNVYPSISLSCTDYPQLLPNLQPGECGIYHLDGRRGMLFKNSTTLTTLFANPNGSAAALTLDTAAGWTISSGSNSLQITPTGITLSLATTGSVTLTVTGTCPSGGGALAGGQVIIPNTFNMTIGGSVRKVAIVG